MCTILCTFAKNDTMNSKTPNDSLTIVTDLVLPSETNPIGNMFGGE